MSVQLFAVTTKMSIYSKTTVCFKSKDGNMYLYDSLTGYCYLHEYDWGREGPLLCKTEDVYNSIWALPLPQNAVCVAPFGGDHRHRSLSPDDFRCLHIFLGVQLRCLVGDSSLYRDYGASLCKTYFPTRYQEVVVDVIRMLERSEGRLMLNALHGILYPANIRTRQPHPFGRRDIRALQVFQVNISAYFLFFHFLFLSEDVYDFYAL